MQRTALMVATGVSLVAILIAAVLLVRNGSEPENSLAEPESTLSPTPDLTPTPTSVPVLSTPSPLPTLKPTVPAPAQPKNTVSVLIVNEYSNAVDVRINGVDHNGVKPGQQLAVEVTPDAGGHDGIGVTDTVHRGCGASDGDNYFDLGSSYKVRIYNTGNNCLEGGTRSPSPGFKLERT